jgi:hypothetical protein
MSADEGDSSTNGLLNVAPDGDVRSSGSSTSGSAGTSGSISTQGSGSNTGGYATFPIIPNHGGGVLATPQVVLVTFDGDPNQSTLENDATWVAAGGYLATVGAEYGVGNGTVTLIRSSATPPMPQDVETFLQSGLANGTLPVYARSNIYVLAIPNSAAGTATFCAHDLGYHSYFVNTDGTQPLYAVIPDCGNDLIQTEVTLAHEVVEASTDPQMETYQIQDPMNPWSLLDGEVADLCASNTTYVHDATGQFSAPLIWSNAAASAGRTPCGPWTSGNPYLSLVPAPTATQTVAAGDSAVLSLTGWASANGAADCKMIVAGEAIGDFAVSPTLSSMAVGMGSTVSITLTVPANALPGQRGAAWIGCADPTTGQIAGSTVVAVSAAAGPTD